MPWVAPKTNWTPVDGVADVDFNRIEGNLAELKPVVDAALLKTGSVPMTGDLEFNKTNANVKGLLDYLIVGAKSQGILASNAYFNGTWNRYDTAMPASILWPDSSGKAQFRYAPAGANPIAWTTVDLISTAGGQTVAGTLSMYYLNLAGGSNALAFAPRASDITGLASTAHLFYHSTEGLKYRLGTEAAVKLWAEDRLRISGGVLQYFDGGVWKGVGTVPMGRTRLASGSTATTASGTTSYGATNYVNTPNTWITILNVSGVAGLLEYLKLSEATGATDYANYHLRVTVDGLVEQFNLTQLEQLGLRRGYFVAQEQYTSTSGVGDNWMGTKTAEPIAFSNSLKIEIMSSAAGNWPASAHSRYKLKAGTA